MGHGGDRQTTIAKAIFEKLAIQFNSKSIVLNVQQEIKRAGLSDVKSKYLSQLLLEDIKSSDENFSCYPRLKRTNALLVFDDVKDSNQLKDLIGTRSNVGEGSRIIVTSRDKQVLENANADEIYQVSEMDYQDSLQLFCLCAFKQNHPIEEAYVSLSKKVLDYAKGIPLALQVLGSLLYRKSKGEWESQLQKLEKLPEDDIFNVMKLSYDGLDDNQKDIFLDIACFHRGEFVDVVERTLVWCGFFPGIGMKVLEDRCLISISNGIVWMHDLIQEMGNEIVRLQNKDPEKRSRLWKSNDVYDVLKKNKGKGTDAIQCIFLNMKEIKEVQLHADTFKKMHNLRMIQFYNGHGKESNVTFHGLLKSFPDNLKLIRWDGFPQRSLPQDFCPENLVILEMPCSDLEQLWEGDKVLPNLIRLNLGYSKKLIRVPDLSMCPNIEELSLQSCTKLKTIPSSIGNLSKLLKLNLAYCESLETFPSTIFKLKLTELNCKGCSMLRTFPEILEPAESFAHINLTKTAIKDLPSSLEYLVGLQRLNLKLCSNLVSLPNSIVKLSLLSHLDCSGCCRLTEIPNNIGFLSSLTELSLQGSSIVNLPESMAHLSSLRSLDLTDCKRFECVPNNIGRLSSLTKLSLEGSSIVNLPESMAHISSLKSLNLSGCKLLENVLELPPNLNQVSAFDCPSIKRMVLNSRFNSREGIFKFHLTNTQELDAAYWSKIGEEACIKITGDAYWPVFFCFPGSVIPCWFHYCCKGHSVTMGKVSPNLLIGFALCVVLGPEEDMKAVRIGNARFMYKFGFISDGEIYSYDHYYMPEGTSNWSSQDRFLNQDHTLIWKHQLDLRTIGNKLLHAHSFTFEILDDDDNDDDDDDDDDEPCFLTRIRSSTVKEFGICPLYSGKNDDNRLIKRRKNDDNSIEEPSGSKAAE